VSEMEYFGVVGIDGNVKLKSVQVK